MLASLTKSWAVRRRRACTLVVDLGTPPCQPPTPSTLLVNSADRFFFFSACYPAYTTRTGFFVCAIRLFGPFGFSAAEGEPSRKRPATDGFSTTRILGQASAGPPPRSPFERCPVPVHRLPYTGPTASESRGMIRRRGATSFSWHGALGATFVRCLAEADKGRRASALSSRHASAFFVLRTRGMRRLPAMFTSLNRCPPPPPPQMELFLTRPTAESPDRAPVRLPSTDTANRPRTPSRPPRARHKFVPFHALFFCADP